MNIKKLHSFAFTNKKTYTIKQNKDNMHSTITASLNTRTRSEGIA